MPPTHPSRTSSKISDIEMKKFLAFGLSSSSMAFENVTNPNVFIKSRLNTHNENYHFRIYYSKSEDILVFI